MPGTGKSTLLIFIIQLLIVLNKRILFSCYTHTAVDNVMCKLIQCNTMRHKLMRIGNINQIHTDLHHITLQQNQTASNDSAMSYSSVSELCELMSNTPLVGVTCLGINNIVLQHSRYDVCIIDEASQITHSITLGPLLYADKFVLVGDHQQLSPLIKSFHAKLHGADTSLLHLLADKHPGCVNKLTQQYRMNNDIVLLCNTLVYQHQLLCGNDDVAAARLQYKQCSTLMDRHQWISNALDIQSGVVWLNTQHIHPIPHHIDNKHKSNTSMINLTEAKLITILVHTLVSNGIECSDIGIISPYRQQLSVVRHQLQLQSTQYSSIECDTVDRYQGRDKDIIIISFVHRQHMTDNPDQPFSHNELMNDIKRINVAITRSKKKLLLIGNVHVVQHSPVFNRLIQLLGEQNWIQQLPKDAHLTEL